MSGAPPIPRGWGATHPGCFGSPIWVLGHGSDGDGEVDEGCCDTAEEVLGRQGRGHMAECSLQWGNSTGRRPRGAEAGQRGSEGQCVPRTGPESHCQIRDIGGAPRPASTHSPFQAPPARPGPPPISTPALSRCPCLPCSDRWTTGFGPGCSPPCGQAHLVETLSPAPSGSPIARSGHRSCFATWLWQIHLCTTVCTY